MVPSERLELGIFNFAEFAGRAGWTPVDVGTLGNLVQSHDTAVLVDALFDLHARNLMEFRQWSRDANNWVAYAGGDRDYFYRPFEVRVTFPGRKYFERLAEGLVQLSATPAEPSRVQEFRAEQVAQGAAAAQATPRVIFPPPPPTAFVSHSGQDRQFVEKFAKDLWAVGIKAWYFPWEIMPGDPIRKKIEEGLEGCEFFIIVISNGSLTRPWVQTELDVAADRKIQGKIKKIIPIKIEQCDHLPPILQTLCWEDFTSQPYESALKRVYESIFEVDVRPQLGATARRNDS
jgi:hypothetical protein